MNNCFCELPDLDNPFTVDDILCEEDLELIHNYSSKSNLGANKVQWHDSTSDFYSGKELKQNFSGVGYITDKKVMHGGNALKVKDATSKLNQARTWALRRAEEVAKAGNTSGQVVTLS